ncbi:MAG: hypothetical protein GEU28_11990 [Dehalococcoidia bacterium]|nr:hypothetical protein [Dehalococcoidia bacterium]
MMHCNDQNCAGGDESITSPDTADVVGLDTSLALDASGFPVVSYQDLTNGDLKILRCNDQDCFGNNESIASPDSEGVVGDYTSLALNARGFPVVSYFDGTNGDLKVMHCNDPNCVLAVNEWPRCMGQLATIFAVPGQPTVGTNGKDVIQGTLGNDFIRGRGGDDVICGLGGNDLIAGNEDSDTVNGGPGRDRALYGGTPPVNVNLAAGTAIGQGNDTLIAIEDASGSSGDDGLRTSNAANRLWGFGGVDTLVGLAGNDILTGGPGPDHLNGGPGTDFCNGSVGLGDTAVNCETTRFVP